MSYQIFDASEASYEGNVPKYSPIGIGKPISIEIMTVYAGDIPRRFFQFKQPDMLVVSGVKGHAVYEAAARAVNLFKENVEELKTIDMGAFDEGTNIIYYSPALDTPSMKIDIEIKLDTLHDNSVKVIKDILKGASGVPIFAPASAYLMAGSMITEMIGGLAKLFNKEPHLIHSYPFRLDTPEFKKEESKFIVFAENNDFKNKELYQLKVNQDARKAVLIDKQTGSEYRGDSPYVIVQIDGRERSELAKFKPTFASAAHLEKFYNTKGKALSESINKSLEMLNDLTYLDKIKDLEKIMSKQDKESDDYKQNEELLNAFKKNILSEEFQQLLGKS